jgi:hypothetical protein
MTIETSNAEKLKTRVVTRTQGITMNMSGMNMKIVHFACGSGKDIANTMISTGLTGEISKPIGIGATITLTLS